VILCSQNVDVADSPIEPLIVFVIFALTVDQVLCPERLDSFAGGPEVIGGLVHGFD